MMPLLKALELRLQGVPYELNTIKLYAYLDDVTLIVSNPQEAASIQDCFTTFQTVSGIAMNIQKTKVMVLGAKTDVGDWAGIPCVNQVKILGITWLPSLCQTIKFNTLQCVNNFQYVLQQHKDCFQTIAARVRFVNVFAVPRLIFVMQLFAFSSKQLAQLEKYIGFFVWRFHILKTKRVLLQADYQDGGYRLKNIKLFNLALLLHSYVYILCKEDMSLSQWYMLRVIKLIGWTLPLNFPVGIRFMPYARVVLDALLYGNASGVSYNQMSVKMIYIDLFQDLLIKQEFQCTEDWRHVWTYLQFLKRESPLIHTGFLFFNNIDVYQRL